MRWLTRWFKKPSASELIAEGCALMAGSHLQEAYDKMAAAVAADPSSGTARAWMADIDSQLILMANAVEPLDAANRSVNRDFTPVFERAEAHAREALTHSPDEERAITVLGRLALLRPGARQQIPIAVTKAMLPAGALYKAKRYDESQQIYRQVMHDAPELAEPVKRAGNCSYAAGKHDVAEVYFRKAVELDPLDAQAHHFLADAYLGQSKHTEAQAATMASIAANPAYAPAWRVLRRIYGAKSRPMRTLRLRPGASVTPGEDGQPKITVWKDRCSGTAPFAAELHGYRAAIEIHKGPKELSPEERGSPALYLMDKLAQFEAGGELEVALLLLCFNESYRSELEAVKRERPGAFAAFVDRYAVTPI